MLTGCPFFLHLGVPVYVWHEVEVGEGRCVCFEEVDAFGGGLRFWWFGVSL